MVISTSTTIFGTEGNDNIRMSNINPLNNLAYSAIDPVTGLSFWSQVTIISAGGGDDIIRSDNQEIYGGAGNDTLMGNSNTDQFYGGEGADTFNAYGGNDSLYGGDANDYIYAGSGDDYVSGDAGDDYLYAGSGEDYVTGSDGDDYLSSGEGNDYAYGGIGNDNISGGKGNDIIYGDEGNDMIYGGDGDDVIQGIRGNDKIYGGVGNDTITASLESTTINGGEGDDIIIVSMFRNYTHTIAGGAGSDRFEFTSRNFTARTTAVITDYNIHEDHIILDGAEFTFSTVMAGVSYDDEGAGVVIEFGTNDQIFLSGWHFS